MTTEGEINIEELRIGDNVLTASGESKPILKTSGAICGKVARACSGDENRSVG
jgi:hypothetical protein